MGTAVSSSDGVYTSGVFLVALSVPFSLGTFFVARRPPMVVLTIVSMGIYLATRLGLSILWRLFGLFQTFEIVYLIVNVLVFDLIVRPKLYQNYWIWSRTFNESSRRVIGSISSNSAYEMNDVITAISCGLGWSLCQIVVYALPVLVKSFGPGTYFFSSDQCDDSYGLSAVTLTAITCPILTLQQISLMLLFFHCYTLSKSKSKSFWYIPFLLHVFSTLWASFGVDCLVYLFGQFVIAAFEIGFLFRIMSQPRYRRKIKNS